MTKIDLTTNTENLQRTLKRVREKRFYIPTLAQQKNPALIPAKILEQLREVGLWDLNPLNLFRITWHNEPRSQGGLFGKVNYLEFPSELTGVPAHCGAGWQVVSDRLPQGGRGLWLPGPALGDRSS